VLLQAFRRTGKFLICYEVVLDFVRRLSGEDCVVRIRKLCVTDQVG
jgi:hypothetical protein